MDYKLGFLGQYMAAAELGVQPVTFKIRRLDLEKVERLKPGQEEGEGKLADKWIMSFHGTDRALLLNRTNAECIVAMFGRDTEQWLDKRITLYATPVKVGRKTEPGIRVKGSPDINKPIVFDLELPRKKPIRTTLVPTGTAAPPPTLESLGLTLDQINAWKSTTEKPEPVTEATLPQMLAWLAKDAARVAAVLAVGQQREPGEEG